MYVLALIASITLGQCQMVNGRMVCPTSAAQSCQMVNGQWVCPPVTTAPASRVMIITIPRPTAATRADGCPVNCKCSFPGECGRPACTCGSSLKLAGYYGSIDKLYKD